MYMKLVSLDTSCGQACFAFSRGKCHNQGPAVPASQMYGMLSCSLEALVALHASSPGLGWATPLQKPSMKTQPDTPHYNPPSWRLTPHPRYTPRRVVLTYGAPTRVQCCSCPLGVPDPGLWTGWVLAYLAFAGAHNVQQMRNAGAPTGHVSLCVGLQCHRQL